MAIYIEEAAAVNALVDYCLLVLTAELGALPLRRAKLAGAAAAGGVYAGTALLLDSVAWLPVRLIVSVLLVRLAFGRENLVRRSALFCGVSFGFAGLTLLISQAAGAPVFVNGVYRVAVSWRALALAAAVGWAGSGLLFSGSARHGLLQKDTETLHLTFFGQTTTATVLRDTGSELRDPMTGQPVLVLEKSAARRLLPDEVGPLIEELTPDNAAAVLTRLPGGLRSRFRLVPYRALGRENGLLLAFRTEEGVLAAISPGRLANGRYEGLIGV